MSGYYCCSCRESVSELCYECGYCADCCNDPEHWEDEDE